MAAWIEYARSNRLLEQTALRVGGDGRILAAAAQQLSVMQIACVFVGAPCERYTVSEVTSALRKFVTA